MNVIRVCVFHMKSHIASPQPGLTHEAYGIMLADCFAFQTDVVAGDANRVLLWREPTRFSIIETQLLARHDEVLRPRVQRRPKIRTRIVA